MAHQAGARFCAIATTNVLPFAGCLKRLGIDALFGVDPMQGGWDLERAKTELGDRVCLWGGVNGYLTIVDGSPQDVDEAVERAMTALAPGGRFILAPVDDVRVDAPDADAAWPRVWQNVARMVEAWKRLR
jgi:uroporphyrinogen decarboxylase